MIKTDRMKRPEIVLILVLVVLIAGMSLYYIQLKKPSETATVHIGDTEIAVEIADTSISRAQGLSDRDYLLPNTGMLFVFEEPEIQYFWMKGMRFPLDVIWINNGYVVGVTKDIPQPYDSIIPRMQSEVPVEWVLEVNAGFVEGHRIEIGDRVTLEGVD